MSKKVTKKWVLEKMEELNNTGYSNEVFLIGFHCLDYESKYNSARAEFLNKIEEEEGGLFITDDGEELAYSFGVEYDPHEPSIELLQKCINKMDDDVFNSEDINEHFYYEINSLRVEKLKDEYNKMFNEFYKTEADKLGDFKPDEHSDFIEEDLQSFIQKNWHDLDIYENFSELDNYLSRTSASCLFSLKDGDVNNIELIKTGSNKLVLVEEILDSTDYFPFINVLNGIYGEWTVEDIKEKGINAVIDEIFNTANTCDDLSDFLEEPEEMEEFISDMKKSILEIPEYKQAQEEYYEQVFNQGGQ